MTKLLPCPFCGGTFIRIARFPSGKTVERFLGNQRHDTIVFNFAAYCVCGAEGPHHQDKNAATEAWNKRI